MKQSIFDFNHIDPHIQEEELEEIKIFSDFITKILVPKTGSQQIQENESAHELHLFGLIAIGAIAGGVTMNPIVLGVISGVGLIIKTAMEMKNLKSKLKWQNLPLQPTKKH